MFLSRRPAAGVASGHAAADLGGCFPTPEGSSGDAVSGSRDVRPTIASGCRAPPGNTPGLSPASSGDNRCGDDVGTPADRTRFVEDDTQRVEKNYYSKDNGGAG